ncbi:hypothetical protein BX283_0335 [Streptomyces sp. TLI_146]|nr:hypothetical protein BX283_0335 [Streptomyces sp. TLI_146]
MPGTNNERTPPGERRCAVWGSRWGHGPGRRTRGLTSGGTATTRAHHLRAGARYPQRRRLLDADRAGADAARSPRRHGGPATARRGGLRRRGVSAPGPQSDGGRVIPTERPRAGRLRSARDGHRTARGAKRPGGAGRTQPGRCIGQPCRQRRGACGPDHVQGPVRLALASVVFRRGPPSATTGSACGLPVRRAWLTRSVSKAFSQRATTRVATLLQRGWSWQDGCRGRVEGAAVELKE